MIHNYRKRPRSNNNTTIKKDKTNNNDDNIVIIPKETSPRILVSNIKRVIEQNIGLGGFNNVDKPNYLNGSNISTQNDLEVNLNIIYAYYIYIYMILIGFVLFFKYL